MRQRALRNYGGGLRPANWAFGRRVHRRDRPETPWSPQVLRGSSSTKVPGLIPAEPESCLSPEPVYRCQKPVCQSLMQIVIGGKCSSPSNFECGFPEPAFGQVLPDWPVLHKPC